jgi:hypothetical protein
MFIKFCLTSLKGMHHSEDLGVDGRIILKCILRQQVLGVQIGFIWLKIVTGGGSCEHGNEHSSSLKNAGNFFAS